MVHIFFTKIKEQADSLQLKNLLQKMPEETVARYNRYTKWQDAHAHLYGRSLLMKALCSLGFSSGVMNQLAYNMFSKPYLDIPWLDFNISHSGEMVMCAVSLDCRIGVDVEEINAIDLSDFKSIFTKEEWGLILSNDNRLDNFYEFWTQKEAVMKANGCGWSTEAKEVRLLGNHALIGNKLWTIEKFRIDNRYASCFASDGKYDGKYNVREVKISEHLYG